MDLVEDVVQMHNYYIGKFEQQHKYLAKARAKIFGGHKVGVSVCEKGDSFLKIVSEYTLTTDGNYVDSCVHGISKDVERIVRVKPSVLETLLTTKDIFPKKPHKAVRKMFSTVGKGLVKGDIMINKYK